MKISLALQPKHSRRVYFPTTHSSVLPSRDGNTLPREVCVVCEGPLWILLFMMDWCHWVIVIVASRVFLQLLSCSENTIRPLLVEAELLVWECQEAGALDKGTGVKLASAAKPDCWNFDWVPDALVEQEVWLEPIVKGRVTWGHVTSWEEDSVSYSF